jgi:hypothetical protein
MASRASAPFLHIKTGRNRRAPKLLVPYLN